MDLQELNELPVKVKRGELTAQEASDKLWIFIYQNPHYFGLQSLDEDQRSDFLIAFSPYFKNLILKYDRNTVSFYSFLRSSLKLSETSWLKRHLKKYASYQTVSDIYQQDEETVENSFEEKTIDRSFKKSLEENILEDIDYLNMNNLSKKKQEVIRNFIHIMACKACNELTDEHISRIASFLNLDEEVFFNEIKNLKKISGCRLATRKKIIERRNQAYFFHKKYLYELMRIDPESPSYEDLIKRYKMHTNTWKKHNLLLSNRFSLSPSAKEIAENVGMKPRTVWFYLNHAKKRKDLFPFLKQE